MSRSSDYKLLDRKVVDSWLQLQENPIFYRGTVSWLGYKQAQLYFDVQDRDDGDSRWSLLRLIWYATTVLVSFTSFPLHIVTVLGLSFLVGAALLFFWTLYMYLSGQALSGFSTVVIVQLVTGSLIMVSLGVVGTYIAQIYNEVKHRPRYVIAEIFEKDRRG